MGPLCNEFGIQLQQAYFCTKIIESSVLSLKSLIAMCTHLRLFIFIHVVGGIHCVVFFVVASSLKMNLKAIEVSEVCG